MAAGLHGSSRTTPRVRAELQAAQASTRAPASQYRLNPQTVAKWRKRASTADAPMGPTKPRSTALTETEEAIVVEFAISSCHLFKVFEHRCLRNAAPGLWGWRRLIEHYSHPTVPRQDGRGASLFFGANP
jgi:transposase-like protein